MTDEIVSADDLLMDAAALLNQIAHTGSGTSMETSTNDAWMSSLLNYPCLSNALQNCTGAMAGYASLLQAATDSEEDGIWSRLQSEPALFAKLLAAEKESQIKVETNILFALQLSLELVLEDDITTSLERLELVDRQSSRICNQYKGVCKRSAVACRAKIHHLKVELENAVIVQQQLSILDEYLQNMKQPRAQLDLAALQHVLPYKLVLGDCYSVCLTFDTSCNQNVHIEGDPADNGFVVRSCIDKALHNNKLTDCQRLYEVMLQNKLSCLPTDETITDGVQELSVFLGRLNLMMSDLHEMLNVYTVRFHFTDTDIHLTMDIAPSISLTATYVLSSPMCRYWCLPSSVTMHHNDTESIMVVPPVCCSVDACATLLQMAGQCAKPDRAI
jgi:hypothetical protein